MLIGHPLCQDICPVKESVAKKHMTDGPDIILVEVGTVVYSDLFLQVDLFHWKGWFHSRLGWEGD